MVSLFLSTEFRSARWREPIADALAALHAPPDLIDTPDTSSPEENRMRAEVLGRFRGYRENRELFEGYPADVRWFRVTLDGHDLPRLKYVDYSYWNELSGGTRRPVDAAATIRAGRTVFDVANDGFLAGLRFVRAGGTFSPLILVAPESDGDLVILEGHVRATVYALAAQTELRPFSALVGLHDLFRGWV